MGLMSANKIIRKRTPPDKSVRLKKWRTQCTEPRNPSSVEDEDSESEKVGGAGNFVHSLEESTSSSVCGHQSPIEPSVCTPEVVVFFVIVFLSAGIYMHISSEAQELQPDSSLNSIIYSEIAELEKSFPGQNPRLWTILRTTILSRIRTSSSLNEDGEIAGAPKVLLISPSSDPAKNESYQHFLKHLEKRLENMKSYWKCAIVDPFSSLHPIAPDKLKRNMHDQMVDAYRSGRKCLHVVALDQLTGDAALALHGNTDPLSSPFKNAFFLLSIRKLPEIFDKTSQRAMETLLRNYLRSLWEKELGGDETYALINRLTGRIGFFQI